MNGINIHNLIKNVIYPTYFYVSFSTCKVKHLDTCPNLILIFLPIQNRAMPITPHWVHVCASSEGWHCCKEIKTKVILRHVVHDQLFSDSLCQTTLSFYTPSELFPATPFKMAIHKIIIMQLFLHLFSTIKNK